MTVSPSTDRKVLPGSTYPRVRLIDVAQAAGVSRTTAHYALNLPEHESKLKPSTRARVLRVAGELGYRPDRRALSLVQGTTGNIGFVYGWRRAAGEPAALVPPDPIYSDLVFAAQEELTSRGLNGMIIFAGPIQDPVEMVIERGVDGLVIYGYVSDHARSRIAETSCPVVLVNINEQLLVPAVNPDDRAGGYMAAEHLIDLGHRRLIYAYDEMGAPHFSSGFRQNGVQQACSAHGLSPAVIVRSKQQLIEELSAKPSESRCTAVICCTGVFGFACVESIRQAGFAIPTDLSVLWFDDSEYAKLSQPAITVVQVDGMGLGRKAVELLCDNILRGKASEATASHLLPVRLIARESTSPPPAD